MSSSIGMELPEHIPIHNEAARAFESLQPPRSSEVGSNEILDAASEYLNSIISHPDEAASTTLQHLIEAYENLLVSQADHELFIRHFNDSKTQIRTISRQIPQITVSNLSNCDQSIPQLSDLIQEKHQQPRRVANADLKFLKNAVFILSNPTAPLPEDEERGDNDDLEIAGGVVDLKCPLTLQYFKDPWVSETCGHTFEKEAIRQTFGAQGGDCPVPGCPSFLKQDQFEKDRIMELRVKVWEQIQAKMEDNTEYERV